MTHPLLYQASTNEERIANLVFRYNPKSINPATGLHTIHTWYSSIQTRCMCGRFHKDDPRLLVVARADLKGAHGIFCKRCTWNFSNAEELFNPYHGEPAMKQPAFKATAADYEVLSKIFAIVDPFCQDNNIRYPKLEHDMDLLAAREDIPSLDLQRLLDSAATSKADFFHDVLGIRRFINRTTGKVEGAFMPRCAR